MVNEDFDVDLGDALQDLLDEAFEEHVEDEYFEYECPECGKMIPISAGISQCECGFVLRTQINKLEF